MKWRPGYYGDCNQDGVGTFIAVGNVNYTAVKACIDFYASQPGMRGVLIKTDWTAFESDTPGVYDGSAGNHVGGAGKIGHPLWDDLLAYAASRNMKVIIGIEWLSLGTGSCIDFVPKYLVPPSCFSRDGTDTAGTYGVVTTPDGSLWVSLWKQSTMDRFIAMLQDFGARYDSHPALEMVSFLWDDSSFTGGDGYDGFTFSAFAAQMSRLPAAIRPYFQHTGLSAMWNWVPAQMMASVMQSMAASYMTVASQDAIIVQSTDGERSYVGYGGAWGSHDYRTELPIAVRLSATTQCDIYNSYAARNGLSPSQNTTPQQYYDIYFTTGKTDLTGSYPMRPSYILIGRNLGSRCPTVANQQFGTTTSGGWLQFIQSHSLNTAAPRLYPSVNTN